MGLVNRTLLLALILSSIGLWETAVDSIRTHKWEHVNVEIYNQLGEKKDFHIHCKASEPSIGDMGDHAVGAGRNYGFDFKVNDFEDNQYFCDLWWPKRRVTFNTYQAQRDLSRCRHYCKWEVTDDFVLGYKEDDSENPDIVITLK